MNDLQTTSPSFLADMRNIILDARGNAVRSVEFTRVLMYWHLGERIFVEEQRGHERAEYGVYLIKNIAAHLQSFIVMGICRSA
jgi:hypothetical protein